MLKYYEGFCCLSSVRCVCWSTECVLRVRFYGVYGVSCVCGMCCNICMPCVFGYPVGVMCPFFLESTVCLLCVWLSVGCYVSVFLEFTVSPVCLVTLWVWWCIGSARLGTGLTPPPPPPLSLSLFCSLHSPGRQADVVDATLRHYHHDSQTHETDAVPHDSDSDSNSDSDSSPTHVFPRWVFALDSGTISAILEESVQASIRGITSLDPGFVEGTPLWTDMERRIRALL